MKRLFKIGRLFKFSRTKIVRAQLEESFPDYDKERINELVDAVYDNLALTFSEIYLANQDWLLKRVKVKGWKNLEKALEKKKGVLLATAHMGNWEIAGKYIAQFHQPVAPILRKQRNELFNDYTNNQRKKYNIDLIYKKRALKKILSFLKRNAIIAVLTDQNAGKKGLALDFLGRKASVYSGIAKIALKTKCSIVPAFAVRKENNDNLLIFEKPIFVDDLKDDKTNIVKLTKQINSIIEEYIKKYPEHWFWVHKRWRGAKKAKKINVLLTTL